MTKPKPADVCTECDSRRMTGWKTLFGTDIIHRFCKDCHHEERRRTGTVVKDPRPKAPLQ